jgi:hypothetical protein
MGPESAKSFPGQQLVHAKPSSVTDGVVQLVERAKQEIEHGWRGKGYFFGAFRPSTGEALTQAYRSRSAANWADFLERVEAWIAVGVARVYAIVDNLSAQGRPTYCCSPWPNRAGSSCSSRDTRRTWT